MLWETQDEPFVDGLGNHLSGDDEYKYEMDY